jgi:hypothetical protein
LDYTDREAFPGHQRIEKSTSFNAHQWAPKRESNYFIASKQKFRTSMQCNSLKAFNDRFWEVDPNRLEYLNPVANSDNDADDFVIIRLTFQVLYRSEIATQSDLFVVYSRGSNLSGNSFFTFQDLLEQAWSDQIDDSFTIKLHYRFAG